MCEYFLLFFSNEKHLLVLTQWQVIETKYDGVHKHYGDYFLLYVDIFVDFFIF